MTDKGSILVVDDDPESLGPLMDVLAAEGYLVRPADSGRSALDSVAAALPQLILLDVRMPGIDGFEVCRRLKADPKTRDTPIIFVSASSEVKERLEGLTLGAVDYVIKPFQREELLARVRTHLELGLLRAQLENQVAQRTAELHVANQQLEMELAERKHVERALRESEARFRDMADTAPVMIWVSGQDNDIVFLNKFALAFSGRTMEQLTGKQWIELVHPDDVSRIGRTYLLQANARTTYQFEYRLRRADGEYRWVLDTAIPRFLEDGRFAGCIGSIFDITELKRSQEQMLEIQKLEVLGALAAGIAHDFNNLLGSILAESELALEEMPESSARNSVQRIGAIAIRAAEIVNLLTAYAEGSGEDAVIEPADLSLLVEEMLQLMQSSISKKAILETRLSRELPTLPVNTPQIRRVVMNLITNASEALEDREGLITVTTSRVHIDSESGAKGPTNLPEGDYVRLEVSDTGCGMTEEAKAKAFNPYYSTKFLGRGLGLAAAQGILRSHRGAINIVSTPGRGATFEVLLPCAACSCVRKA